MFTLGGQAGGPSDRSHPVMSVLHSAKQVGENAGTDGGIRSTFPWPTSLSGPRSLMLPESWQDVDFYREPEKSRDICHLLTDKLELRAEERAKLRGIELLNPSLDAFSNDVCSSKNTSFIDVEMSTRSQ